jgi:hypothetical protein
MILHFWILNLLFLEEFLFFIKYELNMLYK